MTSIRQLRYFVEIAECGSFSAAAERLYIAQSALSRQIKELEQQLGTPLFERTARLPRQTLAGQAFLERSRRLLADLAQAERVTRDIGQGLQGSLRLNHSSTVPLTGTLLARLGNYLKDNRNLVGGVIGLTLAVGLELISPTGSKKSAAVAAVTGGVALTMAAPFLKAAPQSAMVASGAGIMTAYVGMCGGRITADYFPGNLDNDE